MYERKDIPGFPGYQIDTEGVVFSCWEKKRSLTILSNNWHILTPFKTRGYNMVDLRINGKRYCRYIHTLVLLTFVGPKPEGYVTRHFPDRDRTNNKLENLSWGTSKENAADAIKHGTVHRAIGINNASAKLNNEDVIEIKRLLKLGETQSVIAKKFKISEYIISRIKLGKNWKHIKLED